MGSALSARRFGAITAVTALVASLMVLWSPAQRADASLGFDNARMADIALSYVGQPGVNACLAAGQGTAYAGQCKQFVNCIIVLSGGPMPGGGNDYAGSFIAAGGTEISEGAATKGDIIQWGSGSTTSQHTAIVVANLGGGRFDVVDSNWGNPGLMVKHHTITNIHADIFNGAGAQPTRFIRMGTVNSTPPDRDGDGVPDASDRCPDQPGSVTTGGCPDTDGDAVADLDDKCPKMPGLPALLGCSEDDINPMPGPATDFDGDGRADYCRLVGAVNLETSYLSCTLSTGEGFGKTVQSPVVDWGFDTGRGWVDFNGDAKADYCRRVGAENNVQSRISCTLSTGDGFGKTVQSPVVDWGFDTGRAWVDFNGDAKTDYCRRVGAVNLQTSYLSCTLSTGDGFGKTVQSPVVDWGFDTGRAWVGSSLRRPRTDQGTTPPPPGAGPGTSPQTTKRLHRPRKITTKRLSRTQIRVRWKRVPRATGYRIRLAKPRGLRTSWQQVQKPRARLHLPKGRHATVAVRAVGRTGLGPVGKRRV